MTLSSRLWLLGAALPMVVLATGLIAADRVLQLSLEGALDRALLAQAAAESGSLFDRGDHVPHLHMASSPLVESVRPFAPEGALFGPDGQLAAAWPPGAAQGEVLPPGTPGEPGTFATVERNGEPWRTLQVAISDDWGRPWTLRLMASKEQIKASLSAYRWVAGVTTAVGALALALVQLGLGRGLRRRLGELRGHLEAVKAGTLDQPLPKEPQRDELAELREVLAQATRALHRAREAQEQLVANAAHELRTPLSLMRTGLDLALRKERTRDELRAALEETREEVQRLSSLATRLLDIAAIGQAQVERAPFDLTALATLAADAVKPLALERKVTVVVDAPADATAPVHADSLRQALDNLLTNALKFAPAGTQVTLRVKREGERWVLSVSDLGPGIPLEEREKVFEPFHRVNGSSGGAGLGLAIVREVARQHGGRAFVAEVPQGTEVRLELG